MPLYIVKQDITKMEVDAIVNAANSSLLGGGGVDGCIHRAAGRKLLEECKTLGGCPTGDSKITKGYNLPCKFVIHTVGPRYTDGTKGEAEYLRSCYEKSLALAKEYGCESVAFPLISSGVYGYPKDEALFIATDAIKAFLRDNDMTVYLVFIKKFDYKIDEDLYWELDDYITCIEKAVPPCAANCAESADDDDTFDMIFCRESMDVFSEDSELETVIACIDESFSQMLLRKIDERGMSDSECYKKANIDRKLFSKIRGDVNYRPSKPTVIAFAIALELSLEETGEMLLKAGFALSHSNKFDLIIEYFIKHGVYDIYEINKALFAFDQNLLGA